MSNRFLSLYTQKKHELRSLDTSKYYKEVFPKEYLSLNETKWITGVNKTVIWNTDSELWIDHRYIEKPHFYLSYLENNTNFSLPPENDCGIQPNKTYLLNFCGVLEKGVTAELFLLSYKNGQRNEMVAYRINTTKVIQTKDSGDEFRIAIRISGKGQTQIQFIQFIELEDEILNIPDTAKPEFDLKEYSWKTLLNKKDLFQDTWYSQKGNFIKELSITPKEISATLHFPKDKYQYISFHEENVNFGKNPTLYNINVSSQYQYEVGFKGEKKDNANAQLFLIFYSENGKKEQVEVININETRLIKLVDSVKSCRVALKFFGSGIIKIHDIEVKKKLETGFLPTEVLREIGFDLPATLKDVKMAVISDAFTMQCLQPECKLITFGPDNWKAKFSIEQPHILFVESAWQGNGGKWTRKVTKINETNTIELVEVVNWCKEKNIPTVFWNKEDPVHFNSFIETAGHFDYIFTTDENSVPEYKKRLGHSNVYTMPFAAQPKIHNPIETYERANGVCFAGSYYAVKFKERQQDMNILLDAASDFNLTIYDRNYGKNLVEFYFPEHLRKYIVGSLRPNEIDRAYKGYKIALNVNSVVDSPTMFSRRVFECLASNTPVVSTYSTGIEDIFGDIVVTGTSKEEFHREFQKLLIDETYYKQKTHYGLRNVLQKHTYQNRLSYALEKAGFDLKNPSSSINVFSVVTTIEEFKRVCTMFTNQVYPDKHLFLIVDGFDYKKAVDYLEDHIEIITREKLYHIESDFVTFFNSSNFYGNHYLTDLELATKYTDSDILGKGSYYAYQASSLIEQATEKRYSFVNDLPIDAVLFKHNVIKHVSLEHLLTLFETRGSLQFLFKKGFRMFSTDNFNFIRNTNNVSWDSKLENQIHTLINI